MRFFLAICLLVLCCRAGFSQKDVLAQPATFACDRCLPSEALVKISRQTGVNIAFSDRFFEKCPAANWQFEQVPLGQILEKITACARVSLRVVDGQIVFFKKTQRLRLAGYIEDAETGERLIGAGIRVFPTGKSGAMANEFGFFSLSLEEGEYRLLVSYIGYQTEEVRVSLTGDQILKIALRANTALPEIVISDFAAPSDTAKMPGNRQELPLAGLKSIAMPGGEADVLRLAALQPGVQTGVDGLGGLHVRGGNADQNLILLDDVPVYNPSHALGLLSVFNPGAVSKVSLWKGNFPARYGGRASSVLDVRTRDGNFREYHGRVSAGIFASTLELEGPIQKDKSSFLLGGRFTYLDPLVQFFSNRKNLLTFPEDSRVNYRFFDVNAKWNHNFSERDKIYLSFYRGGDDFSDIFEQVYYASDGYYRDAYSISNDWGNTIAAFRWNHLIRKNLFSNTTLTFSRFNYESRLAFSSRFFGLQGKTETLVDLAQLYRTLIRDLSAKSDFTWFQSNRVTLRWGGVYTRHFFQPGALSVDLLLPGQNQSSLDSLDRSFLNDEKRFAVEVNGYMEADWRMRRGWQLMTGANVSYFEIDRKGYPALQPRVHLRKDWPSGWGAWAGYHRSTQNLHQIGSFNISLPFELWVPSTRKVRPEQSSQVSAGFGRQREKWAWQVEGYLKNLDRVLTFLAAYDALYAGGAENASGWEDRIAAGRGWSRGVEVFVERTLGKTTGSMAYTWSRSWRQFADINQGRAFPFRYDRRHDFKLNVQHRFSRKFNVDATWVFATGNPITLTGVKFLHKSPEASTQRTVFVYTDVNAYRLSNYHRLDLAANFRFQMRGLRHELQAGAYNVYNRQNPFFLTVDAGSSIKGKAIQYTLLPFFPVFRYELRF